MTKNLKIQKRSTTIQRKTMLKDNQLACRDMIEGHAPNESIEAIDKTYHEKLPFNHEHWLGNFRHLFQGLTV